MAPKRAPRTAERAAATLQSTFRRHRRYTQQLEDGPATAEDLEAGPSARNGSPMSAVIDHLTLKRARSARSSRRGSGRVLVAPAEPPSPSLNGAPPAAPPPPELPQLVRESSGVPALPPSPGSAAKGASIASSIANLANTNMGVGMLALPRAMASAGFFGGTALLLLSAVLSTFSSHLLAECVDGVGRPAALSRVTARALGRPGVVLTEAAVVIVGTSAAIGYLIVVGDMLPEVKRWVVGAAEPGSSGVWDSRELWICAALPVIVPLGYLRRLDSLRFASFLVVLAVLLIVVTVVLFAAEPAPLFDPCAVEEERRRLDGDAADAADAAYAPPPPPPCRGTVVPTRDGRHTLGALPTFLYAFACQINVPSIASELRVPTRPRMWRVLVGGTALTTTCYLLVAGGAYATFGSRVDADLLVADPRAAIVARVALVYVVVLSHPVVSYPVSGSVKSLMKLCGAARRSSVAAAPSSSAAATAPPKGGAFVRLISLQGAIIALYLCGTTLVALIVDDLGVVISLAGAVSATTVVFIAPGACYASLFRNKPERRTKRRLASALCATGLLLLPLLVSVVILTEIGWFVDDAQEKSIIEHLREPQPSDEGDAIVEGVLPGGSTASVR